MCSQTQKLFATRSTEQEAEISSLHSAMRILRKTPNQLTADSLIVHMYEGYKLYKPHGTMCEICAFLRLHMYEGYKLYKLHGTVCDIMRILI